MLSSKKNDNFQRCILNWEDKPEYGGGQNKNDARLGEGKIASWYSPSSLFKADT